MIKNFMKYPLGFGMFDLQLFADGDDGDGGSGGAPEFEEIVDPKSGNKIKVPKGVGAIIGHHISSTRKATEDKFKPIVEQFESKETDYAKIKEEYEKMKEASMTAEERAAANAKKVIDEHAKIAKSASEEADKWRGLYEKSVLKTDIMNAFGDAKLCNSEQAAILFQVEGNAKISEKVNGEGKPIGEFETRVTLVLEDKDGKPETVEGTPKELFKRWINLERNSHHLMNTMPAGSGSNTRGGGGNRLNGFTQEQLMALSPTERLKVARQSK